MKKLKVLHIAPWFPNEENSVEGIFVWEHIKSLSPYVENKVVHLRFGDKQKKIDFKLEDTVINQITIKPIIDKWIFKEKKAAKVVDQIIAEHKNECDIINFHIAYPNAIKIGRLKEKYSKLKFVITEHWTAYHYNFNLADDSSGKKRMANMFHHNIPVITVSSALKEDIQKFSNSVDYPTHIVPNVIRTDIFEYKPKEESENFTFTSINNWNPMKNPTVLIRAFHQIALKNQHVRLILGGDGILIPKMKKLVEELGLSAKVEFIGRISKKEVAAQLQECNVYVQSSNYETFSVICAEAIATGTPVITTKIGGVLDFIDDSKGILVSDMEIDNWVKAMEKLMHDFSIFNCSEISQKAHEMFNIEAVGKRYFEVLKAIKNEG